MDYTVHGILQARILGQVAVPFSRIFPTQGPKHIVRKLLCQNKASLSPIVLWVIMEHFIKLILMVKTGCVLVASQ